MIIVLNSKKTLLVTSIGLCFIGSFLTALKYYYASRKKDQDSSNKTSLSSRQKTIRSVTGGKSSTKLPKSVSYERSRHNSVKSTSSGRVRTERSVLIESLACSEDMNNLPAEELLELGVHYLNQAIKTWETAVDSIESEAYMQSQTLALPTDEHADLVFKLRSLLDKANEINLHNSVKLIKSSRALQIIQSRLAYKQKLYSDALLKANSFHEDVVKNDTILEPQSSDETLKDEDDDEDNESFVSADSEFDWIDENMFQRIENVNDKNALYEMAFSNANLGRVSYRVSRCDIFNCKSEVDFAAKLHVIRIGYDRYLQDDAKKNWLIEQGRLLIAALMKKSDKDTQGINKAYEEMIKYVTTDSNHRLLKDELATRDVSCINFFDVCLDFILLDAFEDLECPPSAIVSVIQNRWISQSFKETALSTAVWSILKTKRKLLKYPNGFISRFYSLNEYLVPVLAWGFLGTDTQLNQACLFMKNHILEYLKCLFDLNRTRYTNLEELNSDIDDHTVNYLKEINDHIASL